MTRVASRTIRDRFDELIRRVNRDHECIVVEQDGHDLAAVIPVEDWIRLQELREEQDERQDAEEALRRLADPNQKPIPFEQVCAKWDETDARSRPVHRREVYR